MRSLKPILAAVALLSALGLSLEAAAGPPTDFLKSIDKQLKPLLADTGRNEARILQVVGRMMDFDRLCRDSLGRHWDERTDAEREEFIATLRALIEKNVVNRLADTRNHIVTYEGEELTGNRAAVTITVASGTGPRDTRVEITYKMEQRGKRWAVVDMVTDGVSLVQNYRSQFNRIITKDGWDALIQRMKDRLLE